MISLTAPIATDRRWVDPDLTVFFAPSRTIGTIGGIGMLRPLFIIPMTPMVPMPFGLARQLESIACCSPFARCGLPGQNEPRHPRVDQFFKIGNKPLTPSALWISNRFDRIGKVAHRHRAVLMHVPPGLKQVGDHLPSSIAFLGFSDTNDRVVAPQCNEGIADPSAPLFETPQGLPL